MGIEGPEYSGTSDQELGRWHSGERVPACDLRTQLVQRLRDAAHSPDVRRMLRLEIYMDCFRDQTARSAAAVGSPTSIPRKTCQCAIFAALASQVMTQTAMR
jgi:predicted nucleic acid-binding Zn ribbon protein